jgi:mono/diheme cytochrome c family protein
MKIILRQCTLGVALLLSAITAFIVPAVSLTKADVAAQPSSRTASEDDRRLAGEQRFQTNCGRCHTAPHKFPPRMMVTIIRHMRVRATLTDEDMHLILRYMTE